MFDFLDDMFDFDNSGELDSLEESAKFSFLMGMVEEEEKKESQDSDSFFGF